MFENIDGAWVILGSIIVVALIIICNKRHPDDPGNPMHDLDADVENAVVNLTERLDEAKQKEDQRMIDEIVQKISNQPDIVLYRFSMRIFKKTFDYVWHAEVIKDNLESFIQQGYTIEGWVGLRETQRNECRLFTFDRYPHTTDTHDENGLSFLIGDVWIVRETMQNALDKPYIFMGVNLGEAIWKAEPRALKDKTYKSTYFKRKYKND